MKISRPASRKLAWRKPNLGSKLIPAVATISTVVFGYLFIKGVAHPHQFGSVDCDRPRGTCVIINGPQRFSVPVDLPVHAHLHTFRGSYSYIQIEARDGHPFLASDKSYTKSTDDGFKAVIKEWNEFIQTPLQPSFRVSFASGDTHLYFYGFFTIMSLIIAVLFVQSLIRDYDYS